MAANPPRDQAGPSKPQKDTTPDVFEKSMGILGRWHVLIILSIFLVKFPVAWHQLSHIFLVPVKEIPDKNFFCTNTSLKACDPKCQDHYFNKTLFEETIVTQWDLVCDNKILATMDQVVAMFGILVGSILFGYFSDRFKKLLITRNSELVQEGFRWGRKYPFIGAVLMQAVAGTIAGVSPWFYLFLVMRFFSTVATGGYMVVSFVIVVEIVGKKWRTTLGILYQIPFNLGHLALVGFAYFIRHWRYFQIALCVPSFILTVLYLFVIPESPRWLVNAGKTDKAVRVLEKAARCNKLPTDHIKHDVYTYVETTKLEKKKGGNIVDLVRTSVIRMYTICIGYNWLVCGLVFYGGAQYIKQITNDIFVAQALAAIMQIPGTLFTAWLVQAWGRKPALIFANIVAGLCCFGLAGVPSTLAWLQKVLVCIQMFSLMIAFPTVYIYSGELFPTMLRNVGLGTSSVFARVGSMIGPFIADAEELGKIEHWVSPTIFGIIALIGAALCFLLPETLNCKLPDTVEEAEEFKKK